MVSRVRLQGEVDILEGVNDQVPNASSLHTGPGNVSPSLSSPNHALTDVTVFRVLYATATRADRVGTFFTSLYKCPEHRKCFPRPTAPPPDPTATRWPATTLAVVCRPLSPTTTDRHSTIMAADGAWRIHGILIRNGGLDILRGITPLIQVCDGAHHNFYQDLVLATSCQQHPSRRVERLWLDQHGHVGQAHCVLPEHPVRHQKQVHSFEHYHQPDVL